MTLFPPGVSRLRRLISLSCLIISCSLWAGPAGAAQASGLDSLEAFLKNVRSGRAEFTQVVTAPAREGQVARTRQSTGTFEFLRPLRFRFTYRKPFEQLIVADGQTLWIHDLELNQVTARHQAQTLGSTPAAIIASAADLADLKLDFELAAAPEQGGLQWAVATPRAKEGQLRSVRVGFRGTELAQLEILDGLGQRSVITFTRVEVNPSLPDSLFKFRPPPGSDVIRP